MTYTDRGTQVHQEWMPQAMANGIEWSADRARNKDRFDNLYRFRLAPVCWLLWMCGAVVALFAHPKWAKR